MLPRPEYRKLRRFIVKQIEDQKDNSFIAISKGMMESFLPHIGIRIHGSRYERSVVWNKAWSHICKDLGLVDDGTNTNTFTLPGRGFTIAHLLRGK